MDSGRGKTRGQSAIDFITSYGFVLLFLTIAVYVIFRLGVFGTPPTATYCYSYQPINCVAYSINSSTGVLSAAISQSSGGTMNITGAACSSVQNSTKVGPYYGNVNLLPDNTLGTSYANFYPPSNALANGIVVYTGSTVDISVYCYNGGGIATGPLGSAFTGFLYLNYTFSNLPTLHHNIQESAAITAKYT